jgi:hypothetical protein
VEVEKEAPVLEPIIEGVTAVLDPPAVVVENAAFAVLGTVLNEIQTASSDTKSAIASKGLSVTFDQDVVKDLEAVLATCEQALAKIGVLKAPTAAK